MKCPEKHEIQAYIDGELEIVSRKTIEDHTAHCDECKSMLAILKENDDFVFQRIKGYKQHFEGCSVPSRPQFEEVHHSNDNNEGVFKTMLKRRKFVAAACAALLITTCVTVQPVRAAISSALSVFRVENMKGITITLEDIKEIQKNLSSGEGEISLDKMGTVKLQGGKSHPSTPEDLKNLADFQVMFPAALTTAPSNINVVEPASADFTLNVKNVNQIMKSYGATKLLPDSIEGKSFKVDTAPQVTMKYSVNDKSIVILQTKSPEITVPEGVNVDEVYSAVIEMPIIPKNLQSQLKSIKDWKNTLYVPVIESEMTGVDINGVKGYITKDYGDSQQQHEIGVIWYNNGVIYSISGKISSEEILKIARSMK